ncbi:hypothetical protein JL720_10747 [Aureococcus anophagefferens]|nr:hypothetical protein JL720_10747 [Aureococcus anophagefferens]
MSGKSYATPASAYAPVVVGSVPVTQAPIVVGSAPVAQAPIVVGSAPVAQAPIVVGSAPVAQAPIVVGSAPVAQAPIVVGSVVAATPVQRPTVVTVPQGCFGGSTMRVRDPASGAEMQVTIPPGLAPGAQFQVQFPAVQVHGVVVHQSVGAVSPATKRGRGCGVQFELDARTNPASAAAFRCKKCRGFKLSSFF